MQITAGDAAVGGDGAVAAVAEPQHRPRQSRAGRHSLMHLIAFDRRLGLKVEPFCQEQPLVAGKDSVEVEQAEPGGRSPGSLDALGIGDRPPEHLVAAA